MDIGSHRIDLFQDFFGEIVDARGFCLNQSSSYEVEDTSVTSLRFANGVIANLETYFGVAVDPDLFLIRGTHGTLSAQPLNGSTLEIHTTEGIKREEHAPASNLNAPLIADFVDAILSDRPPRVTGESGQETNRIIAELYAQA